MTRSRSSVLLFGAFVTLSAAIFSATLNSRPALAADQPAAPAPPAPAATAPAPPAPAPPAPAPPQAHAPDAPAAADVNATMRRAFTELADPRADVREAARSTLMGLERRYLDDLHALVEHSRPLRPAQATALRQIVTHVYLSGEVYEPEARAGFLGVRAQQIAITSADDALATGRPAGNEAGNGAGGGGGGGGARAPVAPPAAGDDPATLPRVGMVVISRLPGFVAHRVLLDGDVILGIVEQPAVSFVDRYAFTAAIKKMEAGETFHMNILRRGRVLKIELTLDRRPAIVNNDVAGEAFDRDRRAKADAYWRESFAPLLPETVD
jgi:hypothetical protein